VEAKENVRIENEHQTLATITFQNYFRMYTKLAGMTGTADTEAAESERSTTWTYRDPHQYASDSTNHPDVIYKTEEEKFPVCGGRN